MSTVVYCTVHCEKHDSGACECADKARLRHMELLNKGAMADECVASAPSPEELAREIVSMFVDFSHPKDQEFVDKAAALLRSRMERAERWNDAQVKQMVERFLQWKLPENFNPDGGIVFKRDYTAAGHAMKHEPVGTNLLDYTQAEQMVRYMLEGLK